MPNASGLVSALRSRTAQQRIRGRKLYWAHDHGPGGVFSDANQVTSGFCTAVRCFAPITKKIERLGFVLPSGAGAAGDNVRLGIYDALGATLLASTAKTAGRLSATGAKALLVTGGGFTPIEGTAYYFALWAENTGSAVVTRATLNNGFMPDVTGTTISGTDVVTGAIGELGVVGKTGLADLPADLTGFTRQGAPYAIFAKWS